MRKALLLGSLATALAGSTFAATPASAADTLVTFTVGTTGTTVSILPSAALVGVTSGDTVTGTMTAVITDTRITGTPGWTASISSTNFGLVGVSSPSGTSLVPATAVKVWATSATVSVPGTATVTNTRTSLASALSLSTLSQTLMTATTSNANVTTIAESVQIDVTGKDTGAYTGTITQTVA